MYGSGGSGDDLRALESQKQNAIARGRRAIDENFAGFNPEFYDRRQQEYIDAQLPELTRQATVTRNSLAYDLARSGLGKSGVAVDKNSSLDREIGQQQRNVATAAAESANNLRKDVEGQRANLVAQLQVSGDPASAAQAATRTAAAYDTPLSVQPVGNFFGGWTSTMLANKIAREYDPNVPAMFDWGASGGGARVVKG